MVTARDAYDDWYEDDEGVPRRLELVLPARLAFEVVTPDGFEVAQTVADRLREGRPVLIDFRGCEPRLAGRLMDFASGLVYEQHDVGADVVLLTPSHVDVSGDEACGVRPPGFYNRI
jgi:hypothetical protein